MLPERCIFIGNEEESSLMTLASREAEHDVLHWKSDEPAHILKCDTRCLAWCMNSAAHRSALVWLKFDGDSILEVIPKWGRLSIF